MQSQANVQRCIEQGRELRELLFSANAQAAQTCLSSDDMRSWAQMAIVGYVLSAAFRSPEWGRAFLQPWIEGEDPELAGRAFALIYELFPVEQLHEKPA